MYLSCKGHGADRTEKRQPQGRFRRGRVAKLVSNALQRFDEAPNLVRENLRRVDDTCQRHSPWAVVVLPRRHREHVLPCDASLIEGDELVLARERVRVTER